MLGEPVAISARKSRAVWGRPVGEGWESVLGLGWGAGSLQLPVQEEVGQTWRALEHRWSQVVWSEGLGGLWEQSEHETQQVEAVSGPGLMGPKEL